MKNSLKKFLSTCFFSCSLVALFGQNIVTGVVTSVQNEPLIGVTVMVENSTIGTVTDFDGRFSIDALPGSKLVFSYIGYVSQTVEVTDKTEFVVKLSEENELLDELVVIGYGAVKKSDLTGAVSSVKAESLENTAAAGIESALQGKVPGMLITKKSGEPGAESDIKIRGVGSFNSSGPLWVVDGVPLSKSPGVKFNMNDAESVEVLRDGSAAAIYGAAAANGVILVTTKRGRSGEAKISFNTYVGMSEPTALPDMLSAQQLKRLRLEDYAGTGPLTDEEMLLANFPTQYSIDNNKDIRAYALDFPYTNTDYNWRDILFSTGITQNYDLSFSKGTDKYNYYASFNYFDEKGTYVDTGFKRYSFRLNSDIKINNWLTFGESLQLSFTDTNPAANSTYMVSYMRTVPFMMPYDENNQPGGYGYFPTTDSDGTPLVFEDLQDPTKTVDIKTMLDKYDGSNPLADEYTTNIRKTAYDLTGNIFVKIQPIKQLTIQATLAGGFGMGNNRTESGMYQYYATKARLTPTVTENLSLSHELRGQLYATYTDTYADDHSLTVMLGAEGSKSKGTSLNGTASSMLANVYWIWLANQTDRLVSDSYSNSAGLSYFGRVNYSYKDKYIFMALLRRDGYDRFGYTNRWGTFPSFSGAWRISEEDFIRNNDAAWWLTNLKLRASYGILGNVGIDQFLYTSSYVTTGANYTWGPTDPTSGDQSTAIGLRLNQLPNVGIKWEEIATTNVGVDFGVLNNTLLLSADFFIKNTSDAIFKSSLPGMAGIGSKASDKVTYVDNVGKIRNTGLDFELTYQNHIGKDFNFSVNANMGFVKNEVLATNESNEVLIAGPVTGGNVSYTQKGYPIASFFAYEMVGVFQTQEQVDEYNAMAINKTNGQRKYYQEVGTSAGDLIFRDVNGDGFIDSNDITYVGNPWPKFTYGFNLSFNWRFVDFIASFQGVYGNKIYNDFRTKTHTFTLDYNTTTYALNRWTGSDSTNENFRLSADDPNLNEKRLSTWFLEDGSYLRLKNIQIGLSLPKNWLDKTFISKCRFYVSAQNLFTITKYEGFDPEFNSGNISAAGIDTGFYPQSKSYLCGLQLDF